MGLLSPCGCDYDGVDGDCGGVWGYCSLVDVIMTVWMVIVMAWLVTLTLRWVRVWTVIARRRVGARRRQTATAAKALIRRR